MRPARSFCYQARSQVCAFPSPFSGFCSVTLDEAVQRFLASKEGEGLAAPSLAKYKLTLSRLTDHFIGKGITQLSAVTAAAVLDMLDGGTLRAASAKLNNQSRRGGRDGWIAFLPVVGNQLIGFAP
jgi:hypothetical protein